MKRCALLVLTLAATAAYSNTLLIPHVLEAMGKIQGVVYNPTGGYSRMTADGTFQRDPLTVILGNQPSLLKLRLPTGNSQEGVLTTEMEWSIHRAEHGKGGIARTMPGIRVFGETETSMAMPACTQSGRRKEPYFIHMGAGYRTLGPASPRELNDPGVQLALRKCAPFDADAWRLDVPGLETSGADIDAFRCRVSVGDITGDGVPERTVTTDPWGFSVPFAPGLDSLVGTVVPFSMQYGDSAGGGVVSITGDMLVTGVEPGDLFTPPGVPAPVHVSGTVIHWRLEVRVDRIEMK